MRVPVRPEKLWLVLGLLLAGSACGFAACGGTRGFAQESTPTPTRTPRLERPTATLTVAPSPPPTDTRNSVPTDVPAEEPSVSGASGSTDMGDEPTRTPEPATPTATPTQTATPTPEAPEDDPLGDEVEALLEELIGLFEQADPLGDLPGS